MIFSSRVFSGITLLAGSGVFWIVQDGCGNTLCSSAGVNFGKSCKNAASYCSIEGSINDFEMVCRERCTDDGKFKGLSDCASCTNSTVYGTGCSAGFKIDNSAMDYFTCTTLSTTNPGGEGVSNCTQRDCGRSFNRTFDCYDLNGGSSGSGSMGSGGSPISR
jgi:hypothetical protein